MASELTSDLNEIASDNSGKLITAIKSKTTDKVPKSNAQRQKEFQQRKRNQQKQKSNKKTPKTNAEHQKEFRQRKKNKKNEIKRESPIQMVVEVDVHQEQTQNSLKIQANPGTSSKIQKTKTEVNRDYYNKRKALRNTSMAKKSKKSKSDINRDYYINHLSIISKEQQQNLRVHSDPEITTPQPESAVITDRIIMDNNNRSHLRRLCVKTYGEKNEKSSKHELAHNRKRLHQCAYCEKTFIEKYTCTMHERTHTGERPYQCKHCEKSFIQKISCRNHERSHTGERPYQCKYCEKSFIQKSHCNSHERTHTGERPYQCKYCEKSFTQLGTCISHERSHTGERPYQCKHCEKSFSMKSNCEKHEKIHTDRRSYRCKHCKEIFTSNRKCTIHERTHTNNIKNDLVMNYQEDSKIDILYNEIGVIISIKIEPTCNDIVKEEV